MTTETKKRRRGRPRLGERRPVTMNLPASEWEKVDSLVAAGHAASTADYFRQLHEMYQQTLTAR